MFVEVWTFSDLCLRNKLCSEGKKRGLPHRTQEPPNLKHPKATDHANQQRQTHTYKKRKAFIHTITNITQTEMVSIPSKPSVQNIGETAFNTCLPRHWAQLLRPIPRHDTWDCHRTADQARGGLGGQRGGSPMAVPDRSCLGNRALRSMVLRACPW